METLDIIFICAGIANILLVIVKWANTGDEQFSAIAGWTCAILYCLQ